MNLGSLTGIGILWLSAAGFTAWAAEKNEWSTWKWWLASVLTGPFAWSALYLKHRDRREKIGPTNRRSPFRRRLRPGEQARRDT